MHKASEDELPGSARCATAVLAAVQDKNTSGLIPFSGSAKWKAFATEFEIRPLKDSVERRGLISW